MTRNRGKPARAARPGWPALLLAALVAPPAGAEVLDIGAAFARLQERSGTLQGARLDAEARRLQREAVERTGGPTLAVSAFGARVSSTFSLDTSNIASPVNAVAGELGAALPGLPALPSLPDRLSSTRTFNLASASAVGVWPLYAGGRFDDLRHLADGRAAEAAAELRDSTETVQQTLVQRYFSAQLARRAAELREAALRGVAQHQHQAERFEAQGLIARHERLRADQALAQARADAAKARSDAELAQLALDRLLDSEGVQPGTPLFVHSQPVGPLAEFVARGRTQHPAWDKLAAKRTQAAAASDFEHHDGLQVLAFGSHTLNKSSDPLVRPDWAVGVLVRLPLWGAVDGSRMRAAARLQQDRVEALAEQARRDIPTLVESQWRALENARAQYLATDAAVALAQESLRLATASARQGQGTVLDAIDAQLNLAKVQTEQAQLAYQYDLALAGLLAATGDGARFAALAAGADLHLPPAPVLP